MSQGHLRLAERRRHLLRTRWGAVFASGDFLLAVPLGIAAAVPPALSDPVAKAAPPVLLTSAGIATSVLALSLAAAGFLGFLVDQEFMRLIRETMGSAEGLRRPFLLVASVAASAVAVCLGSALVWPVLLGAPWWLQGVVFGLAAVLLLWAIFGAVQLVELGLFLAGKREQFAALVEQRRQQRRAG